MSHSVHLHDNNLANAYRQSYLENMVNGHGVRAFPDVVDHVKENANRLAPDKFVVTLYNVSISTESWLQAREGSPLRKQAR